MLLFLFSGATLVLSCGGIEFGLGCLEMMRCKEDAEELEWCRNFRRAYYACSDSSLVHQQQW